MTATEVILRIEGVAFTRAIVSSHLKASDAVMELATGVSMV